MRAAVAITTTASRLTVIDVSIIDVSLKPVLP
jgi:hypothetical protein